MNGFLVLLSLAIGVLAQHDMGQFTGSAPGPFIPPSSGPSWWPSQEFVAASGELLPNPGASMFAFQFNGPDHGKNFITLPRSLSADLARAFTVEAWIYLPPKAERATQKVLPIISRFNPRLRTGPNNLDSYNDFALEVDNESNELLFWMGGQHEVEYGFNLRSSSALPIGEWVHVAASVVSSESRNPYFALLTVNGKQVASGNWASGAIRIFQTTEAIAVGFRQSGDDKFYFEGLIDELRVWSEAKQVSDIADATDKTLAGDEENLTAYYRLDDYNAGTIVDDANGHHGFTLKPLWTLGAPQTLNRQETGAQQFAVEIALGAVDLVPTAADGFEYQLTCLPEHGCAYDENDEKDPPQCFGETDLGVTILSAGNIMYTGDADYLGEDKLCIRARRVGDNEWSEGAQIDINVVPAPATGCLTRLDACGVCGGDGTSCTTGGCDGKGGQFDNCGVCGGDNSSCQCAVYKGYKLSDMDCVLFDHAINRTMVRIENSVALLVDTLDQLAAYDAERDSGLDLLQQIRHLCGVKNCVSTYSDELAVFNDYATEFLSTAYLCEEDAGEYQLLTKQERERMANP